MNKITSWSYSRLATFKQCPYKAKLLYIDKKQEPQSEALTRGSAIHKKLEDYMNKNIELPQEAGRYQNMVADLKKQKKKYKFFATEYQLSFNRELKLVEWMAEDVWLRGIFDVVYLDELGDAYIVDYKTGKRRDEHENQADMYAVLFYLWNKEYFKKKKNNRLPMVNIAFWYLDNDNIEEMLEKEYNKETCELLLQKYYNQGKRITDADDFPKKRSPLCNWCYFKTSGDCGDDD